MAWMLPVPRDRGQVFIFFTNTKGIKDTILVEAPDTAKR